VSSKRLFPGETKPLTDRQRRARFKGIFVALSGTPADPAAGFLCSECVPLETDISSTEVEVWRECSHGWTGPVLCNDCHLSIPVYVDAHAEKTPPEDSKGNLISVFREEDRQKALEAYNRAGELDTDPKTYEAAEELYRKAIRLDPEFSEAHTNLGNVLYRRNDPFGAVECYETAARIDPKQVEAYYNIGCVWADVGNPKRAIPFFKDAMQSCDPDDKIIADIYWHLARSLDEIGDVEAAHPLWIAYLRREPKGEWADMARRYLKNIDTKPARPKLVAIRGGKV